MGFRGQYKNKRDANEPVIIAAFKARGVQVERADKPLDLICGYKGRTYLVEVKMPGKRLNSSQKQFTSEWIGQWAVVWCIEDVADLVRRWADDPAGFSEPCNQSETGL